MGVFFSLQTKSFYDLSFAYKTLPPDLIAVSDDEHRLLLAAMNNGKEVVVKDGKMDLVDKPVQAPTWDVVRSQRNALLAESDWTQMPDYPGALKPLWAAYRQSLRNIPQKFSQTDAIVWPEPPGK